MRECEGETVAKKVVLQPLERNAGLCKDETEGHCTLCGTSILVRLHALPVCTARKCRRAWLGRNAAATQRTLDATFRDLVSDLATSHSASLPVGLLPANTRALEPVTSLLRDRFVATIRTRLLDYPPDAAPAEARAHHDPDGGSAFAVHALLGQGCATCGGACCTRGGTHAFLSAAALRGTAHEHTGGDTGAALEALYTSHLPTTHYAGSCVFHGERGCTLPRALRSDTCNRYLCGELTALSRSLTGKAGERAVVGAATWSSLERVAVIDASGSLPLPLPATTATLPLLQPS